MTRFTNLVRLDIVDSTNRYAVIAARAGAEEGLVVVADEQTEGRGRLGRSWVGPRGESLLCSVVLRPTLAPEDLHIVPTVVALAAADAAEAACGTPIDLKWPNDLVVHDRKLGGILAEVAGEAGKPEAVVVGIGMNLEVSDAFAALLDAAGVDAAAVIGLAELAGAPVDRDALLEDYLRRLEQRYSGIADRHTVMDEYRYRCVTIGRRVRVEMAEGSVVGRAFGLAGDGRLEVTTDDGPVLISAGDVVHLRDA